MAADGAAGASGSGADYTRAARPAHGAGGIRREPTAHGETRSLSSYPCASVLEDVRKYMRLGLEALSSQGSDDAGAALRSRAQVVAEQLSSLAAGFLEWSGEAKSSLLVEIRDLVARQVQEMGVATKKDLESLQARLERLERLESGLVARSRKEATGTRAKSTAKGRSSVKGDAGAKAKGIPKAKSIAKAKSAKTGRGRGRAARGPG